MFEYIKLLFDGLINQFLYHIQWIKQGFPDSDVWDLDCSMMKWLQPRLNRYMKLRAGHPAELTDEQWRKILDDMHYYVSAVALHIAEWEMDSYFKGTDLKLKDRARKYRRGKQYFKKYLHNLWD